MNLTITKYVIDQHGNAKTFLAGLGEEHAEFWRDAETTNDVSVAYRADTAEQAAQVLTLVKVLLTDGEKAAWDYACVRKVTGHFTIE